LVLCLTALFLGRKCRRDFVKTHKKALHLPDFLSCAGLYLAGLYRRLKRQDPEAREEERLLFVSEEEKLTEEARRFGLMLLLTLIFSAAGFLYALSVRLQTEVKALRRPEFGETRTVELRADGLLREENVRITLRGRDPDEESYEALFDREYEEILGTILNGNASFSEVRQALSFPSETKSGIRLRYKSENPTVLSSFGRISAEEIPEEGLPASIILTLSYGGFEKDYRIEIVVLQGETANLTEREQLEQLIREEEKNSKDQAVVTLPESLGENKVSFFPASVPPAVLPAAALILCLWFLIFPEERRKERLKKRERELEEAFPKFLLKFLMLRKAGFGTRRAWERILKETQSELQSGRKKTDALYDEIQLALSKMQKGVSEEQAYLDFGSRCRLPCYRRLGNYLSRSLRQGIAGGEEYLQQEMEKALAEEKNRIFRRAEEEGTALLIPMVLMLGLVMALLVVPAFMSFY
ncbi:MAG: hypothetical protein IKR59_01110, partial [Lachnospiraceae bacterium]|nr:hypothetical protein [Lachnospiraceae bacterium]